MMTRVWLVACVLVAGCNGSPETFWRGVVRASCRYNRDCTRVDVPPIGECADELYADVMAPDEFGDECQDYEMEIGRKCLASVRAAREVCTTFEGVAEQCQGVCGLGTGVSIVFIDADGGMLATPQPGFSQPPL
jgi:hypothetical protein